MSGFFDFIRTSFWHVAPILLVAAFALAITIERVRALYMAYPLQNAQGFFDRITDLVLSGKMGEAVSMCDRYPQKPVVSVVKQGLLRAHQPEALIENGLQLTVGESTQKVQRRTAFLAFAVKTSDVAANTAAG